MAALEEAKKLQLDIDGMNGSDTAASVARLYDTPRAVVDRVQGILKANQ